MITLETLLFTISQVGFVLYLIGICTKYNTLRSYGILLFSSCMLLYITFSCLLYEDTKALTPTTPVELLEVEQTTQRNVTQQEILDLKIKLIELESQLK